MATPPADGRLSPKRGDLLSGGEALFAVGNRNALAEALQRSYRARAVTLAEPGQGVVGLANRVALGAVTLHYCRYEAPTRIAFGDMPGFRQFFCLGGQGRIRVSAHEIDLSSHSTGIVRPGGGFEADYGAGYAHLVVQVDEVSLDRLHQSWDGDLRRERLPILHTLDASKLGRLRNLALCLAEQFDEPGPRNDLAVAQLEQAVVGSFLFDNLLRAERPRSRGGGQRLALRLQAYIEANWDQPLRIETLADACGVSVRSVFVEFQRQFETTPLAYLRRVRLDRARALLSDPQGDHSVMDVAMRCGFSSFGHFARRYRETFGELPSATRERARWR